MYILFEEMNYKTRDLGNVLPKKLFVTVSSENSKVKHVGYISEREKSPILILPKIFLNKGLFFGIPYHEYLYTRSTELLDKSKLSMMNDLIIKFYLSIKKYTSTANNLFNIEDFAIVSNIGPQQTTKLDVILSIIEFSKKNPYLFINKNIIRTSNSTKKINWNKVINKTQGYLIDDNLIFPNHIVNTRTQTSEDLLLILYYNLLDEFKEVENKVYIPENISLLKKKEFELLKIKALNLLKRVKNQYFQDLYKRLWSLLYLYFDLSDSKKGNDKTEYLLVSNYELVFETMVDYLLSEEKLLRKYKILKDNKEVDHLFLEKDIFSLGNIIHIGDSKYYKDAKHIKNTRYKQFTYAKNIITENIHLELQDTPDDVSYNYRDKMFEGYNFTPNFFIYGYLEEEIISTNIIKLVEDMEEHSYHFPNRFFDRDTLHIFYFKINLVFLLEFYINKDINFHLRNREFVRSYISTQIRKSVYEFYDFYVLQNNTGNADFFTNNFKVFNGKIFISSFKSDVIYLCLNKLFTEENEGILELLTKNGVLYSTYSHE